ncbi:MAG TPA: substrate-binding domain-containing protein [Acidobacteriota bacterium]|nr:substrate-binding domain-containing protein [Acidobacteriota bacterium]
MFAILFFSVVTMQAQERLRLATTTSVQDSGLLSDLLPVFENICRCRVDVIAVGTGQALKLASNGDVDMVLVHDPEAEMRFVSSGNGINRTTLMVNDFVILGPAADPAAIRGMNAAAEALSKISEKNAMFISRGDRSGTHSREMSLWQKTGTSPRGSWYMEIGQGMGAALTMASEKQAYTISDRSTYLARKNKLRLEVLVEGDPELLNYYSAIQVNPARFPRIKGDLSRRLIEWLCSPEGQERIGNYTAGGHRLFRPACKAGNRQIE